MLNNRHRKYVKEDKLLVQPRQVNNNKKNDIPLTKVANKKNLVNNRLLMKLNKKLIVEPQNKKKELVNKPVDYIYNEKINNLTDLGKQNQQLSQNYQGTYDRSNYWYPLWMQYNYPNVKMYDMKVLVPNIISDSYKVDSSDSTNTSSKTSRSTSTKHYSLFNEPIPLIVKKKSKINENFKQGRLYNPRSMHHSRGMHTSRGMHHSRATSKPMIKYSGFGKKKRINTKKGNLSTSPRWGDKIAKRKHYSGSSSGSSYGGPYLYYPFGNYYYYNRYGLPFSLDDAIIPIPIPIHMSDSINDKEDKEDKEDKKDKKDKKKNEKEGFKNEIKDSSISKLQKVSIPKGYRIVVLRMMEIDDTNEYDNNSNLICMLVLIVIIIYFIYNKYKKNI
jgi:hypothetical protein